LTADKVHIKLLDENNPSNIIQMDGRKISFSGGKPYLYYEGKKYYPPIATVENGILKIGNPENAGGDTNLSLYIELQGIENVILNGAQIWSK
jgi:hypothetical protein